MFLLRVINMAAPPTINLFRELFLFSSLLIYSSVTLSLILTGSLLVACYCISLFSLSHHGIVYSMGFQQINLKEVESLVVMGHVFPLVISFLAVGVLI
jgi:hypothetical protein